jgi:hypothetical protein
MIPAPLRHARDGSGATVTGLPDINFLNLCQFHACV